MPELPDLEVFAANLEKRFKNKTLEQVTVSVTRKLNVSEKELNLLYQRTGIVPIVSVPVPY